MEELTALNINALCVLTENRFGTQRGELTGSAYNTLTDADADELIKYGLAENAEEKLSADGMPQPVVRLTRQGKAVVKALAAARTA